jgi:hypothetical protein
MARYLVPAVEALSGLVQLSSERADPQPSAIHGGAEVIGGPGPPDK